VSASRNQRPSARRSWALFIDDRPSTFRRRASAYSWAYVGPAAPLCERFPPRRDDDMSSVEERLAVRASPDRARSLFTVRAQPEPSETATGPPATTGNRTGWRAPPW
jgi:hypothetical protein